MSSRRGYESVDNHSENLGRSKRVKIVWEDTAKEFCESLVSNNLWKRSKEIKDRRGEPQDGGSCEVVAKDF